jgi:hypothetical protein
MISTTVATCTVVPLDSRVDENTQLTVLCHTATIFSEKKLNPFGMHASIMHVYRCAARHVHSNPGDLKKKRSNIEAYLSRAMSDFENVSDRASIIIKMT